MHDTTTLGIVWIPNFVTLENEFRTPVRGNQGGGRMARNSFDNSLTTLHCKNTILYLRDISINGVV